MAPPVPTETASVLPVVRSRTKTSVRPLTSPGTRLVASLLKTAKRPSALNEGDEDSPSLWPPSEATETRSVLPVSRSCAKASVCPLVSPATRLVAPLPNPTRRPSALMVGLSEKPSLWAPSEATETRSTARVRRSVTKTSRSLLVSSATNPDPGLANVTTSPSALIFGHHASPLPWRPSEVTETRSVARGRGRAKSARAGFVPRTVTFAGSDLDTSGAAATTWWSPSGTSSIVYRPLRSVVATRLSGTPSTVTVAPGTVEPVGP